MEGDVRITKSPERLRLTASVVKSIDSPEDILNLVPDRQIPEWIKTHRKSSSFKKHTLPRKVDHDKLIKAKANKSSDVDANNMRKSWRSAKERVELAEEYARLVETSHPEAIRPFPYDLRKLQIPQDSPVAVYAKSQHTRKVFSPARSHPPPATVEGTPRSEDSGKTPDLADLEALAHDAEEPSSRLPSSDPAFLRLDQSQLPLQMFDSNAFVEVDLSPEEWMASGCEALAPFYREGQWTWRKCKVLSYDPVTETFEIMFPPRSDVKHICRFNLCFESEDKSMWAQRRAAAALLREQTKERLRFNHFVACQPSREIMPMARTTLKGIYEKIADGLPGHIDFPDQGSPFANLLRTLTADAIQRYTRALKAAVVLHKLKYDSEMVSRYHQLKLPPVPTRRVPPYYGKVQIPRHDFATHAKHVAQMHYSNKRQVLGILKWLYATWEQLFANLVLMDIEPQSSLSLPCHLEEFRKLQQRFAAKALEKLTNEWRRGLTEQLVDNLQEVYDFFQSNPRFFQQGALFRLFKQLELRMADHLRQVHSHSMAEWLRFLGTFCDTATHTGPSLFAVRLVVHRAQVVIEPSPRHIREVLLGVLDEITSGVRSLQTVDSTLMALLHLPERNIFRTGVGDEIFADVDRALKATRQQICDQMAEAMSRPSDLAARYDAYAYLMDINSDEFVEDFEATESEDSRPPASDDPFTIRFLKYRSKVQELHDAVQTIERESFDVEIFPLIQIDVSNVKTTLAAKALELRDALLSRIVGEIHEHNQVIIERYEEILTKIGQKPRNEEELAALRDFIAKSKDDVKRIMTEAGQVREQIELLGEFEYEIPVEEKFLAWSIMEYPSKVDAGAKDAEERLEEDKVRMLDKLALEKEKFETVLEKLQLDAKRARLHSEYERYESITEEVNALQDAINDAKAKADDFNARERVSGFPPTDYPILTQIESDLQPFHKLWNMIYDFHISWKEWLLGPFLELNGPQIETEVTEWWKASYKFAKTMEDQFAGAAGCAIKLRDATTEFRQHLPVIQSLASPALKSRHWELLSERIGKELEPDEELTLKALLDMSIGDYIETIQEVCVAAKKEYDLETMLSTMKNEWAAVQYEVLPYRSTGTFVISGIDDIISLLDEHLAKTQTMRTSPYIKPIEATCKDWEFRLKYAQGLLDEWIKCQRTWMYLEPIFGSEDIMRQLPTEARRFNAVDQLWRKTMADANQEPAFMVQCDPEKKLKDKFLAANQKLDEIQKGLSDYLETKRLAFSRFWFLSDAELLDILSDSRDPLRVQPHLRKCFEGIYQVEFDSASVIVGFVSSEGERMTLKNPLNPIGKSVEVWLSELELEMKVSVRESMSRALMDYPAPVLVNAA